MVWTDTIAHRTVPKIECSHASFSDHVVKQYKIDIRFWSRKNRDRSMRKKLFEINARKIEEGQKRQLIAGPSRCDGCTTILNEKRIQRYAGKNSDLICSTKRTLVQSQPATDSSWSTSDECKMKSSMELNRRSRSSFRHQW